MPGEAVDEHIARCRRQVLGDFKAFHQVETAFQFEATPGWHTEATEPRACPGVAASRCTEAWSWTSTVPWQDCRTCTPHLTLRTLLRNGIIISVSHVRERPVAAKRQIEWPLRRVLLLP